MLINSRPVPRLLIALGAAVFASVAAIIIIITAQASYKPNAAWADTPVTLNPAHVGAVADDFEEDCSGPLDSPPGPNYDGWHFVLPATSGDNFTSITVTFSGGVVAGPITALSPATDSGPGWVGFLADTGSGDVRHAYIFTTPVGQSIVSGIATVSPDETTPGTFNLSHTCPGTSASPSPSPSMSVSPSPSPSMSTSPSPSPSISSSPTPSMSTSRPPRPTPSRTRPGYGYGDPTPSQTPVTPQTQPRSWWEIFFG